MSDRRERAVDVSDASAPSLSEPDGLALIAHEVRGSLAAIVGFALTLRDRGLKLSPENHRSVCDTLVRSADWLSRLATDILDLDRAQNGRLVLRFRTVDLRKIVADLLEEARRIYPDVEFRVSGTDTKLDVIADEPLLGRAVDNLIRNAVGHSPAGSSVDIEMMPVLGSIVLAVRSDGEPVPEELRSRLFERYARGRTGGTGLGLYLCRLIVEAHEGYAWYSSDPDGNRFGLLLPSRERFGRRTALSAP